MFGTSYTLIGNFNSYNKENVYFPDFFSSLRVKAFSQKFNSLFDEKMRKKPTGPIKTRHKPDIPSFVHFSPFPLQISLSFFLVSIGPK